jgi:hypothetical protein
LVLDGSIDQKLAQTVIDKQDVIERALNGGGQAITDACRPVVIEISEPATKHETSATIAEAAKTITEEEIAVAHAGVRRIAAMDYDYARTQNGVGFSKIDCEVGHSLASCPTLTPKQGVLAQKLCRKYRRQLGQENE